MSRGFYESNLETASMGWFGGVSDDLQSCAQPLLQLLQDSAGEGDASTLRPGTDDKPQNTGFQAQFPTAGAFPRAI